MAFFVPDDDVADPSWLGLLNTLAPSSEASGADALNACPAGPAADPELFVMMLSPREAGGRNVSPAAPCSVGSLPCGDRGSEKAGV